jgi:hypothetical protein
VDDSKRLDLIESTWEHIGRHEAWSYKTHMLGAEAAQFGHDLLIGDSLTSLNDCTHMAGRPVARRTSRATCHFVGYHTYHIG